MRNPLKAYLAEPTPLLLFGVSLALLRDTQEVEMVGDGGGLATDSWTSRAASLTALPYVGAVAGELSVADAGSGVGGPRLEPVADLPPSSARKSRLLARAEP